MPRDPGRWRRHRAPIAGPRTGARRRRRRGRSRRPEYLHRHRLCRSGRTRRHPPHSSRKSRRAESWSPAVTRSARRRRFRRCPASAWSSEIRTSTSWPITPSRWLPRRWVRASGLRSALNRDVNRDHRRHLRSHRVDGRSGLRSRLLREDPPQPQGAGWLQ